MRLRNGTVATAIIFFTSFLSLSWYTAWQNGKGKHNNPILFFLLDVFIEMGGWGGLLVPMQAVLTSWLVETDICNDHTDMETEAPCTPNDNIWICHGTSAAVLSASPRLSLHPFKIGLCDVPTPKTIRDLRNIVRVILTKDKVAV